MKRLITVDTFLEEVKPTSIRSHFKRILPIRNELINSVPIHEVLQPDASLHSPFVVAIDTDKPSYLNVARLTTREVRPIAHYQLPYLRNSIISNVFFKWPEEMKKKLDVAVFSLYYYIFLQTDKLNDITHNVCYEMEEMVKTVIKKEMTLYREYNTLEVITELRARISNERLLNMGWINRNINFRR